jgi:hypothetical protein
MKRILSYHPTKFPFTDAGLLRLHVKRQTVGEAAAFRREYEATKDRASARQVSTRMPGEEQETRQATRDRTTAEQALADALSKVSPVALTSEASSEHGQAVFEAIVAARRLVNEEPTGESFVIDDAAIRQRRLDEMTPETRSAWEALVRDEDAREAAFITDTIERFVTVEPDQIVAVDGTGKETSLTSGQELLSVFGANLGDMRALVQQVWIENNVSEERKKALRSLFDFDASSAAPAKDPAGSSPEATVESAEPKGSAGPEDATASRVM